MISQPSFRTFEVSEPSATEAGFTFVTVASAAIGRRADITVYAPPEARGRPNVPIVLLLHGVYGSHWSWAYKGAAHLTLSRLVTSGDVPPMVLVMPSDGLWGDGSGYVPHRDHDFERWILDEVPSAARRVCPAYGTSSPLCVAGLSMGGFAALRLAGKYPRRFLAAAAHSAITDVAQLDSLMTQSREGWSNSAEDCSVLEALLRARDALPPMRFDCGTEDALLDANRALHDELETAHIPHVYAEHRGGHDWDYWRNRFEDTLLFFADVALRRRDGT